MDLLIGAKRRKPMETSKNITLSTKSSLTIFDQAASKIYELCFELFFSFISKFWNLYDQITLKDRKINVIEVK